MRCQWCIKSERSTKKVRLNVAFIDFSFMDSFWLFRLTLCFLTIFLFSKNKTFLVVFFVNFFILQYTVFVFFPFLICCFQLINSEDFLPCFSFKKISLLYNKIAKTSIQKEKSVIFLFFQKNDASKHKPNQKQKTESYLICVI